MPAVFVFDPTASDPQSAVRGIGRYLQILKENFPEWIFTSQIQKIDQQSIFINPFFNLLKPPLAIKRIAHRQIAIIHDLIPFKYPTHFPIGLKGRLNIFLNKISLRSYDLIITDSEASRRDITTILNIPIKRVKVIYPSLPKIFNTDSQAETVLPQFPFCLYVGDATWNKNLVNLARAIKIANITCVFVGKVFTQQKETKLNNPWAKELKEFLILAKNDKRFIFPGFISDKKLIQFYRQARLNVLVSRDEGFGFSYLEAASQKTPSVLADIPVFREIAGDSALFANPDNPNTIADQIIRLYFDSKLRSKFKDRTLNRVRSYLTSHPVLDCWKRQIVF